MKLNLGCGNDIRTDYLNIDCQPVPGNVPQDIYKQGYIQSLDWIVENGTIEEIIALDCIEYLVISDVKNTILNWTKKLKPGGTIKILMPDCFAIAVAFGQGQFSITDFLQMMYGTQKDGDSRQSALDSQSLYDILHEAGLTITKKRFEGVAIYVEAVK